MPTRPISQTTGIELHGCKLEPDRFKTPIMSTSIDETQNPGLAWWSNPAGQTEQWLTPFKKRSATNVTSLCQSVNLPTKSVFSGSKWPWTSYLPMHCRYTQRCHIYNISHIFKIGEGVGWGGDRLLHFMREFLAQDKFWQSCLYWLTERPYRCKAGVVHTRRVCPLIRGLHSRNTDSLHQLEFLLLLSSLSLLPNKLKKSPFISAGYTFGHTAALSSSTNNPAFQVFKSSLLQVL